LIDWLHGRMDSELDGIVINPAGLSSVGKGLKDGKRGVALSAGDRGAGKALRAAGTARHWRRDRRGPSEVSALVTEAVDAAVGELVSLVGAKAACAAVGQAACAAVGLPRASSTGRRGGKRAAHIRPEECHGALGPVAAVAGLPCVVGVGWHGATGRITAASFGHPG
jgi:hypothetical protein